MTDATEPSAAERAVTEEEFAFVRACETITEYAEKHLGVLLTLRPRKKGLAVHVHGKGLNFTAGAHGEGGIFAVSVNLGAEQ